VRPQGRQHVDQRVAVVVVNHARQLAGAAGGARIVRRHGQDAATGAEIFEDAGERLAKLLGGEFSGGRAKGEVERHRGLIVDLLRVEVRACVHLN
jgi:hypothetical protein